MPTFVDQLRHKAALNGDRFHPSNDIPFHLSCGRVVASLLDDPEMDDAPNYRGIGGTIGHELTHDFDAGIANSRHAILVSLIDAIRNMNWTEFIPAFTVCESSEPRL
jgi:hypothetical protein